MSDEQQRRAELIRDQWERYERPLRELLWRHGVVAHHVHHPIDPYLAGMKPTKPTATSSVETLYFEVRQRLDGRGYKVVCEDQVLLVFSGDIRRL